MSGDDVTRRRLPRQLAAILFADVAGYSRLTSEDEDATHRLLSECLDLTSATIKRHAGRVMHYAGDGVLAKFRAVIDALSCAIEIQRELAVRNANQSSDRRVELRIGVNLGDVIADRGDIYGDGVNVAARLEALARAGEICVSESVRVAIGKCLPVVFEDLGEQSFKNIAHSVHAYRVRDGTPADSGVSSSSLARQDPSISGLNERVVASETPSVAVLPFVDMSPQRDQEYFCDGMAEEVINELARIPGVQVAARTTSFVFKNRNHDVREIARQLGVTSVLEGSVRKEGAQLRVNAQLVDARTGFQLWSQRWDGELRNMFAIQDDIARRIAAALRSPTTVTRAPSPPVTADALYHRAVVYRDRGGCRNQRFAMELFRQALELEPRSGRAWAGLALSYLQLGSYSGQLKHGGEARSAAAKAIEVDARCAEAWIAEGATAAQQGDFATAESAFNRGLECGPRLFDAHFYYGRFCFERGQFEKAAALYGNEQPSRGRMITKRRCLPHKRSRPSANTRPPATRWIATYVLQSALADDPTDARALALSAGALIQIGRVADARTRIERACTLEPDEPYVHYNAACLFMVLNEADKALEALERTAVDPEHPWITNDPDLAALRDHPRFKQLMVRRSPP